uniref:Myb/SANT-like domain-containing protein n=1 Tax=Oryza brachyantha TaxID=4533 RepID=J3MEF7_ORYBR
MCRMAEAASGNGGQGGHQVALRWTSYMSSFMLKKIVELIAEGVRTDKGFKEVQLNQVARSLSDHYGLDISGTQVYNHLRKWRQRWVRVTRLKDISGALWDNQNSTIVLEDEHYMGHVKDHPKDAEFLNVPLENYTQMATIFSNGQATGKYAMGSNEALGKPADMAESDLGPLDGTIGYGIAGGMAGPECGTAAQGSGVGPARDGFVPTNDLTGGGSSSDRKRKKTHAVVEGEAALITNMTKSVREVAAAIRATTHTEVHPELSDSVLNLPGFTEDQLELVLTYLTNNKATSLVYI